MAWEGVPWMVSGGNHSAEVGRLLAYAATGGEEGVIGPTDCKVVASAIPDGNIHIQPGAVACLNRFPGGASQSYMVRNVGDEVKALTPQGSAGIRYDLIAIVVEDPQYPGQPAPVSVPNGPYTKTKVYENVPANTTTLAQVAPNQTGYALARVKFDASDGTVNTADITDLRDLLIPRVQTVKKVLNAATTDSIPGSMDVAPPGASWAVYIPKWASKVQLEARWAGLKFTDTSSGAGYAGGYARVSLGTLESATTQWIADATASNKPVTQAVIVGDTLDVTEVLRGTTQNLQAKLHKSSGAGMTAQTTPYTTVVAEATFYQATI
jgi:hypothetical protein